MPLIPVKTVKISSNDSVPIIYVPKDVQKILGFQKGIKLLLLIDGEHKRLVIEKIPPITTEEAKPSS